MRFQATIAYWLTRYNNCESVLSLLDSWSGHLNAGSQDLLWMRHLSSGILVRIADVVSANVTTRKKHWLNPAILTWAREWRGRTLEEAAEKAKKSVRDN